jgi:hypothetical protein
MGSYKDGFSDWVESREGDLMTEYAEYILEHKDIVDEVFYFDASDKVVLERAKRAKEAWENWLEATYNDRPCMEPEDMPGSER